MSVLDVLKAARAKIEDSKHWIKGNSAQTPNGETSWDIHSREFERLSKNPDCAFCAAGAVGAVAAGPYSNPITYRRAIYALREHIPSDFDDIASFNDHAKTTHADILALFDRAIATEEAKHTSVKNP